MLAKQLYVICVSCLCIVLRHIIHHALFLLFIYDLFYTSLYIQLIPLKFKSEASSVLEGDASLVKESECMSASDVISNHSGPNGCIAFAVRRPGEYVTRYYHALYNTTLYSYITFSNILISHL